MLGTKSDLVGKSRVGSKKTMDDTGDDQQNERRKWQKVKNIIIIIIIGNFIKKVKFTKFLQNKLVIQGYS